MEFGFIRTAAVTPHIKVCDCVFNSENIVKEARKASEKGAELVVFPELCITGYTCGDLFLQKALLDATLESLEYILKETSNLSSIIVIGAPLEFNSKLYNCAVVIKSGEILGIVPKTYLPNYGEFYERRHFQPALDSVEEYVYKGKNIPFGTKMLFCAKNKKEFVFGVEICEDLWSVIPPSSYHAMAGATIIANLSAGSEITAKEVYRKRLVSGQSARLICGYIYASAGEGESTTDLVFSGHNMISENGFILAESKKFENSSILADIDTEHIVTERRRNTSFEVNDGGYKRIEFDFDADSDVKIERKFSPHPFVPQDLNERNKRCEEILNIQAQGLKKRIEHIGCRNVVIGISGGLDSTHALIVTARAFEKARLDTKGIIAVTMPCFGTTDRTYNNAIKMCKLFGTTLLEINIKDAVLKHFEDIGQDVNVHDVTFENSQARERTQVLMDLANKYNGIVIGTGDLSELALGFATFNGDHMSMYGVNASVPKTLIKYLIEFKAVNSIDEELKEVLTDVLDTPVSPELLPPQEDGTIAQITQDIVGPYELHDFFLYYMMRKSFEPLKILRIAEIAFEGIYNEEIILKWLKNFYKRFFAQQFKRSTLPDGPKVGSVSLSPRGDWRMPSDACMKIWIDSLEKS